MRRHRPRLVLNLYIDYVQLEKDAWALVSIEFMNELHPVYGKDKDTIFLFIRNRGDGYYSNSHKYPIQKGK